MTMPRRRKGGYFPIESTAPSPLIVRMVKRIAFSDVDPMGILWHGRYAKLFEAANEELGRLCGMSYPVFRRDGVRAPIVQFHVDYFASPVLAEQVTTTGRLLWNPGARLNIEYEVYREDGRLAAAGYTVQMFVDENGVPFLAPPKLQELCLKRWLAGDFGDMK